MIQMKTATFDGAARFALSLFSEQVTRSKKWQGVDISNKPEMGMHEILHYVFSVQMQGENLDAYRADIKPNLPWADNHFLERVGGDPVNPGETWKSWPYAHSASKFLDGNGQFNHNYMERYWPKYAGLDPIALDPITIAGNQGIRGTYGDLYNVASLLYNDPTTRQAYLPVWFPEDTGDANPGRKPCTLGYHFIMRDNQMDVVYFIRSCDYIRHFRDDIYLTVRLLLWLLNELREIEQRDFPKNRVWENVVPGEFIMYISNLHMFRNDYLQLKRDGLVP